MLLGKSGWPRVSKLDCLAPPVYRVPADMVWRPRSLCPLELILGSFCWSRPGAWHTGVVTVFGMCAKGSVKEQMNDQQVLIPGQIHQPGGHVCCMCILTEKLCWPTPVMSALSISEPEAEGSGVGNSLSNIVKSCYQKSSGGGGGCGCGLDGDG